MRWCLRRLNSCWQYYLGKILFIVVLQKRMYSLAIVIPHLMATTRMVCDIYSFVPPPPFPPHLYSHSVCKFINALQCSRYARSLFFDKLSDTVEIRESPVRTIVTWVTEAVISNPAY